MFLMAPVQSPTNSNNNNPAQAVDSNTGKGPVVQKYLTNCKSLYSCIYCRTHLADHDELVSRSFQGNHGRAYLFNSVINVYCGQAVQRALNTGSHAVADIFCTNCDTTLGWKYEKAYVEEQKYKEGKYIIELAHVVRENRHLELDKGELLLSRGVGHQHPRGSSTSYSSSSNSSPSPSQSSASSEESSVIRRTRHQSLGASNTLVYEEVAGKDDDDEDLMFPFYDDLCSSRSSYPSSFTYSQHSRIRRSLYLESTPYDWKHAGTSAYQYESNQPPETHCNQQGNTASLIETSCLSSWSSSPSSSSQSSNALAPLRQPAYHASDSKQHHDSQTTYNYDDNNTCINVNDSEPSINDELVDDGDDIYVVGNDEGEIEGETQFKFDTDKLDSETLSEEPGSSAKEENKQLCDHMTSDNKQARENSGLGIRGTNNIYIISETNGSRVSDREPLPVSSGSPSTGAKPSISSPKSLESSMSLDDEEFYDCYTEHDVAKMTSYPTKA